MEFTVGERICCVGRTGWSKQIEKSLSISFFLFHIEFLMDQRLTCSDSTVRPTPMQACQHYRVACKCNHKTKRKTSKMKRKMFGVKRNYDNTHIVWGLSHAFNGKKNHGAHRSLSLHKLKYNQFNMNRSSYHIWHVFIMQLIKVTSWYFQRLLFEQFSEQIFNKIQHTPNNVEASTKSKKNGKKTIGNDEKSFISAKR